MTVATFDYAGWAKRYPELAATVDLCLAEELFVEAGAYCDNSDCSIVPCDPVTMQPRRMFLGMLVAHLAALTAPAREGIVGRVASASQGSVSVSVAYDAAAPAQWFLQTPYGANFWQATAQYRTFRYAPGPAPASSFNSLPFVFGGGFPWQR